MTQNTESEVLAWATDRVTGQARHISEVRTGAHCGCICPACGHPLLGVNAGKQRFRVGQRRPHFRHAQGVERSSCLVLAARDALRRVWQAEGVFELPARRRESVYAGSSGENYSYEAVAPVERVSVRQIHYDDAAIATLVLDDGRRLRVVIRGSFNSSDSGDSVATISIDLDPADVAQMSPEDLRTRIFLERDTLRWVCHWRESELRAEAHAGAEALAAQSADWLPADLLDVPAEWRRESALHLAVKKIIEDAGTMTLPEMKVTVSRERWPHTAERRWVEAAKEVRFDRIELEHRLGRVVPDVVAMIGSHCMLIEVVVTHPVGEDKLDVLRKLGVPCMEINLSRSSGQIRFAELRKLVLDDLDLKRWLHHPRIDKARQALERDVEDELDRKHADHQQQMRRSLSQSQAGTISQGAIPAKQSTAQRYAAASGRDAKRFGPRARMPIDSEPSPLLSGAALEQWRNTHPERYKELLDAGFFEPRSRTDPETGNGTR
jgi:hypothetical protein